MPATNQTLSNASAALKILYTERKLKEIGYTDHPFWAMLKKSTDFTGVSYNMPIWYAANQGGSRTFSTALSGRKPNKYAAFALTRAKDYVIGRIDIEALKASRNDPGAFLKLGRANIDGSIRALTNNLAVSLFRNQGGARGQVASIASTVLTLSNAADVVNFEVGMTLVQSTADGTSGSLGSGNSEITAIDRRAGTLTAANWTNFSANDYLFRAGDFGSSVAGVQAWVPPSAPTSTLFFGVDRTVDSRLYGQGHDGSAQDMLDAILDIDMKLYREGARCDVVFVNPADFNSARKRLGADVIYDKISPKDMASVSFNAINVVGMTGNLKMVADNSVPVGYGLVTQMDSWEFCCLELPGLQSNELTGEALRIAEDEDSVEYRCAYYGNLGNHAPAFSGTVKFY
jgi:hypothetical protein